MSGLVPDTRIIDLADGRELAFAEYGAPDGAPIIAFHGSPGSRFDFSSQADVATKLGVRLVAPDRPGYGYSTFHPARTYESWASDVGQLADHVGLARFGVLGWSSGGPNSAACARFLGDRLSGCAIVSGPAPPEANIGLEDARLINRVFERGAFAAPRLLAAIFGAGMRLAPRNPKRGLAYMRRTVPECDVAVIDRPEVTESLLAMIAKPMSRTAARAAVQDVQLEGRPWGFPLGDIAIPVHVWHGDADRNVPFANGEYQSRQIPDATMHALPGEGHWIALSHFEEILDAITA
jgi:pimeloyl-ACP methyl ester carboxylesterase